MKTQAQYTNFLYHWNGLGERRPQRVALRAAVDHLQGYIAPYSDLESAIIPRRVKDYSYGGLDGLCETGELAWQGHERLSAADGLISLYWGKQVPSLARIGAMVPGELHGRLRRCLAEGAREFAEIRSALGGFPPQILGVIWELLWAGEVSNTRLLALEAARAEAERRRGGRHRRRGAFSGNRRLEQPPGSAGRWYLLGGPQGGFAAPAVRDRALIRQLIRRWGIIGAPTLAAERVAGGLSRLEGALSELVGEGSVIRGELVRGLGARQYADPGAAEMLGREHGVDGTWILAATDPANPFGAVLPWPGPAARGRGAQRVAGASVVLLRGEPLAYLHPARKALVTFGANDARETQVTLARGLATIARPDRPVMIRTVDGGPVATSPQAAYLRASGFMPTSQGYVFRGPGRSVRSDSS